MLRLETILESQRFQTSYDTLLKLTHEVFLPIVSAFCQGRRVSLLDYPSLQMISVTVLHKKIHMQILKLKFWIHICYIHDESVQTQKVKDYIRR